MPRSVSRSSRDRMPLLMTKDEAVPLKRAAEFAGVPVSRVRRWNGLHGIARQAAACGPLEVSLVGLSMVLHGDLEALELLRSGSRSDPRVRRHLDHLGLP